MLNLTSPRKYFVLTLNLIIEAVVKGFIFSFSRSDNVAKKKGSIFMGNEGTLGSQAPFAYPICGIQREKKI